MNYAYYAAAQFLCSTEFWQRLTDNRAEPGTSMPSLTEWELLLLRITAGLSFPDCAPRSKSAPIGIVPLLIFCAGSCPAPEAAKWIENWVRRLEDHGIELDGIFPNSIIRRTLQELNVMKLDRRDCYLLSLLEPTDLDRDDIYSPGAQFGIAMCGKDWKTGHLWNTVSVLSL